jgi:ABC-type antimicrobial peptide transport system permease subunit
VGGIMVLMLILLAIFSDFFSPTDPNRLDMAAAYTPPQRVHFFDEEGNFHLRPFVDNLTLDFDPDTFEAIWTEDTSQRYPIHFLVNSWEYELFGLIPMDLHLYAMSIIFALIGWTVLAREVRGKVMAFRSTDFIMAAKEMGASDRRIIFRHLYPHALSHVIVILTLTIPEIILAEAFLSFLGISIQEPLTSWGLLMRDAQSLETLGSHPWIMTPAFFIIIAVLGFNFLGDGLRDAADVRINQGRLAGGKRG